MLTKFHKTHIAELERRWRPFNYASLAGPYFSYPITVFFYKQHIELSFARLRLIGEPEPTSYPYKDAIEELYRIRIHASTKFSRILSTAIISAGFLDRMCYTIELDGSITKSEITQAMMACYKSFRDLIRGIIAASDDIECRIARYIKVGSPLLTKAIHPCVAKDYVIDVFSRLTTGKSEVPWKDISVLRHFLSPFGRGLLAEMLEHDKREPYSVDFAHGAYDILLLYIEELQDKVQVLLAGADYEATPMPESCVIVDSAQRLKTLKKAKKYERTSRKCFNL